MPEMIAVNSSILEAVGYDPESQELVVHFSSMSHHEYVYYEVPESVFKDLLYANSVGKFFSQEIKGKYQSIKRDR